jgi:ATP-binding cassette subfamily B protein
MPTELENYTNFGDVTMTTGQPTYEPTLTFDFRKAIDKNHLKGLWKMMVDYRLPYIGATAALAVSALAKTLTYMLLLYFVDDVLTQGKYIGDSLTQTFLWIAAAFVGLALFEGGFAFLSGRLAAYTAEGITRRLRDFLFDHIQRLSFSYHTTTPTGDLIERVTSDVDALRRFFSEQGIGMGRIVLLFVINFIAILNLNVKPSFRRPCRRISLAYVWSRRSDVRNTKNKNLKRTTGPSTSKVKSFSSCTPCSGPFQTLC